MLFLRQSTASQEILLGPFVDSTDGATAETALTIAAADIKLFKHGATAFVDKNSGGATHISNGQYYAVLDATDTDTVGLMEIAVRVSGALPVRREFQVVEEAVYDALFASGAAGFLSAAGIADAVWDEPRSGHVAAGSFGEGMASVQGNVTGTVASVTGAVGSVTGAVGSVTGSVGSVAGNVGGNVVGSVGSVATGGITSASFAASSITAAALAADAVTEIVDGVWDEPRSGHETGSETTFAGWMDQNSRGAIADTVWDEPRTSHVDAGSFGESLQADAGAIASATSTTAQLAASVGTSIRLAGWTLSILSGTGLGQARTIVSYDSATRTATVRAWDVTPDVTSRYTLSPPVTMDADGLDLVPIESGVHARQALRGIAAAVLGVETRPTSTTVAYAAAGNSGTPRIVGTIDAGTGRRSAVTLTLGA